MCPLLSNKTVKKQFYEIKDVVGSAAAYDIWSKNNGYSIDRAPDGSSSVLFNALMKITGQNRVQAIRMKAMVFKESFLKWYGRWFEKELGEPQLHRAGIAAWYDNGSDQVSAYNKRNPIRSSYAPYVSDAVQRVLDGLKFRQYRNKSANKAFEVFRRRLTVGFGSFFANHICDMYQQFVQYDGSGLTEFYNRLENFVRNEFFDKLVPDEISRIDEEIKNIIPRSEAESLLKSLYSDLKMKYITGDFEKDKERYGDKIGLITKLFPKLYNAKNIGKIRGYYMHQIVSNRQAYLDLIFDSKMYFMLSAKRDKLQSLLKARESIFDFDIMLINKVNNEIIHLESARYRYGGKQLPYYDHYVKNNNIFGGASEGELSNIFEYVYVFNEGIDVSYNIHKLLQRVSRIRPEYKPLCDYILQHSKDDRRVYFADRPVNTSQEDAPLGRFHHESNEHDYTEEGFIFLNKSLFLREDATTYDLINTLIHEITHTYSSAAIEDSQELNDVFNIVLQYIKKRGRDVFGVQDTIYGLKNSKEFVAESVSNPAFVDYLTQFPAIKDNEDITKSIFSDYFKISNQDENLAQQLQGIIGYVIEKYIQDYSSYNRPAEQQFVDSYLVIENRLDNEIINNLIENIKKPVKSAKKIVRDTILKVNNAIQKIILDSTVSILLNAYNLEKVTDSEGKLYYRSKQSTEGKYDLIVEFVNYLQDESGEHEGWYDYNAKSTIAHHVIQIALNEVSPATLSHELAHHYIKMFWNSPLIQESLAAVFKEGMTSREVEEALVDEITNRVDPLIGKNIFSSKFWETLGKMMQMLMSKLTNKQKEELLNNCTKAFITNERQTAWADSKFVMEEGRMYKNKESGYSKAVKQSINKAKTKKFETLYKQYDTNNPLQTAVNALVSGSISRVRIIGNYGSSSDKVIASLRQQEQKSIDFANSIAELRESRKNIVKDLVEKGVIKIKGVNKKHKAHKLITESKKELVDSWNYITSSLRDGVVDVEESIRTLQNAQTFNFLNIAYTTKTKQTKNASEDSLLQDRRYVEKEAVANDTIIEEFDFDKMQIIGKETISYYKGLIKSIERILDSAQNDERISDEQYDQLESYLRKIKDQISILESLYDCGRRQQIRNYLRNLIFKQDESGKLTVDPTLNLTMVDAYTLYDEMCRWMFDNGQDVRAFEKYIGVKAFSKSPIIRAFHNVIFGKIRQQQRDVNQKLTALQELKRKAKLHDPLHQLSYEYESQFIEKDENGKSTGYFISRIHRQRFEKAKEKAFDEILFTGQHSIEKQIQNLVGDSDYELELDEFGEPIIPDSISQEDADYVYESYYKQVEEWKSENVHRQFTPEYYSKRLEVLGVAAIREENKIQRRINNLLKLCMVNGRPKPELLSAGQARQLKDLYKKKRLLSSPYDEFGVEKLKGTREYDIYTAEKNWKEYTKYFKYTLDEDSYTESYNAANDKETFVLRNTNRMISSAFWDYFKEKYPQSGKEDVPYDTVCGKYSYNELTEMRRKLISIIKDSGLSQPSFDKVIDTDTGQIRPEYEQFFANLRMLDKAISEVKDKIFEKNNKPNTLITRKPRKTSMSYVVVNGKQQKQTWYKYLEQRIVERWKKTGDPDWKSKAAEEVNKLTFVDNDGKREPLSIFYWTSPNRAQIVVNGKTIDTIERKPISLFSKLDLEATSQTLIDNQMDDFVDNNYDQSVNEHEQPLIEKYGNKQYERFDRNSSKRAHDSVIDYYEALLNTMKEGYSYLPFDENKSMKIPQIGMSFMEAYHKYGWKFWKTLKYIYKRTSGITENDEEYIEHEYDVRTDDSIAKRIPIRYLKMFDDQREVTQNLLGSVVAFYDMATGYSVKRDLSSVAIALYEQAKSTGTKNQQSVLGDLIDKNIYERKLSWMPKGTAGKTAKVIAKRTSVWKSFALLGLLAGKVSSGLVALGDALLSLIQDGVVGKHTRQKSIWAGWFHMLCSSPKQLVSLFSSKSYSKTSKLMQYFGLSINATERARMSSKSPVTKNIGIARIMMSPFEFADYTIKAMALEESLNNYRWCENAGKFLQYNEFMEFYARYNLSYKQASRDYGKAPTLRSGFDMSNSKKLFADNLAGRILSDMYNDDIDNYNSFINSVTGKVMYRSAYYNGAVEETSASPLQSNPFSGWVVMVRNFMLIMAANKFSTNDDFFIYGNDELDEEDMEDYLNSEEGQKDLYDDQQFGQSKIKSYSKDSKISKKQIEERRQHHRKGYYNFMYNTKYSPEIQGAINAITRQYDKDPNVTHSLIRRVFHNIGNLLSYRLSEWAMSHSKITGGLRQDAYNRYGYKLSQKRKKKQISDTEIDAINTIICALLTVALLIASSATFHNMLVDDYGDELWFRVLDKILLRLGIEKMSGYSFTTITELITAVTAGQSPIENFVPLSIMSDLLQLAQGDDTSLKTKKTGTFKGHSKLFQDCINSAAFLGLRGIYSDTNIDATKASTKFYMDMSVVPLVGNASAFWKDNKKGFMYKNGSGGNSFGMPPMQLEPMMPMEPMEPMPGF